MYDKESLIAVLERHGYVQTDIQKSNIRGDMLQFAISIIIAERLDKLVGIDDSVLSYDDLTVNNDDTSGGKPNED